MTPHTRLIDSRRKWRRRLVRTAAAFAVCYVGVLSVLLVLENWLVFRPVPHTEEWCPAPAAIRAHDVELTGPEGTVIHGWWCSPAGWEPARGAVLYCHGNGSNLSHWSPAVPPWHQMGRAVLLFDYPGFGRSGGRANEASCYAAAEAAFDWLVEKHGVPPQRILFCGFSLGGGVATELAHRRPDHEALVLINTFTSVPDVGQKIFPWLPIRWLMRNGFDNRSKIGGCPRPVFIAHATDDRLIPFSHGEQLFAAAPHPKQFFPLQGQQHGEQPGPDFYAALGRFLAEARRDET